MGPYSALVFYTDTDTDTDTDLDTDPGPDPDPAIANMVLIIVAWRSDDMHWLKYDINGI